MYLYEIRTTRHKIADVVTRSIRAPRDIFDMIHPQLAHRETEALIVLSLNTKNVVIGMTTVYQGNVSAAIVRVGEVLRDPVRVNASGFIIVHNHPSGDAEPSSDDLSLTAECIAAGRMLDIPCLDHVVIAEDSYVSLRDRGVAFGR